MAGRTLFGAELRRRRLSAGLSLGQLGALVHYSKGYLSKIESGDKAVNRTLATLCDTALRANGELVVLVAEAAGDVETDEPDGPAFGGGSWGMRLSPDGAVDFARGVGTGPGFDDASLFAPSFGASQMAADPATLCTLFGVRFDQARSLGQMVSPVLLLPMVISETHVLRCLAERAPDEGGAALWRLAAQFAEFAGWMIQESGDDRGAMWWTATAVRMAARGGDDSLRPYALFRRADLTLHADDPLRTIELAQRAQADPAATARVCGLALQREAQGHALLGDQERCFEALNRSEALLDEAKRSSNGGPVLGTTWTPDSTIMARGWCLFDLGRPSEAAALLETGIGAFAEGAKRARARYGVRTALAHVAADEVDRACEILEWLGADLMQIDSATVRHDLRLLNREFRRRSGHARVQGLLPMLADLLRGPDARG
jgi:hypothetical protein